MTMQLVKYPRTNHIQGSRFQPGDEDLDCVPFSAIEGRHIVVEEKMDGANSAISFSDDGKLLLQSRGHYLTGGPRETHFSLLKQWASSHQRALSKVFASRYIAYGEWLYAKHTIFYDRLPHYWLEFDLFDRENNEFLSTGRRHQLLQGLPVKSVSVLFEGTIKNHAQLEKLVEHSRFITQGSHLERLREVCTIQNLDAERALSETDGSSIMEGLYIKVEEDGVVKERYKYIRASFLQSVASAQGHWLDRPVLPNQLMPNVDLFGDVGSDS